MKTIFPAILTLLSATFVFSSCKKNSTVNQVIDLTGKWNTVSYIDKLTNTGGSVFTTTTISMHPEYFDFRTDGKLYSKSWHTVYLSSTGIVVDTTIQVLDTSFYTINHTQLITARVSSSFIKDTFVINLTGNQLGLYLKRANANLTALGIQSYETWGNFIK